MFENEHRRRCPLCGSIKVKEVPDKTRPIYYQAGVPIYAKKIICRDCNYEWKQ